MNPIIDWVKQHPINLSSSHNTPNPKEINPQQANTNKVKDLKDYEIDELKALDYKDLVTIANNNNLDISNYSNESDIKGILTVILVARLQG
jgi:hypothetical protein